MFLSCAAANAPDREMLVNDLLSTDAGMDCVVLYVDPPNAPRDETLLEHELRGTQGLVLWVTKELLEALRTGNIPAEYHLARELHIPVLPIAKFDELLSEFTRLVGSVHAIAKSNREYRAILRTQLERLFVTEEQMETIRKKAFIAKLFLSYRKMDIEEARRFMKMLHDVEEFEAISIWYDNFLTLGDNFDEEIEKFIKEADAFTLVVTPNLLQPNAEGKPNFVQTTEYPTAQEKHKKPIIPVEALPTDFEIFARLFPGVDKTVPLTDTALHYAFRAKLGKVLNSIPIDSERAYHLGMAYLKGYGVERDFDRAIKLLERAAEDFSKSALYAATQLAEIHENSIEITIDYGKALWWWKKVVAISEHIVTNISEHILDSDTAVYYDNIGTIYGKQGNYQQALEWHQKALAIKEKIWGVESPDTAVSYNNIGLIYDAQGCYQQALACYQKTLTVFEKVLGGEHPSTATAYNNIGEIYRKQNKYPQALEWHQKALVVRKKVWGVEHPDTAASYDNIGIVYKEQGDYQKTLTYYQKARTIFEKILGVEHPDTAKSYTNIGVVYCAKGEYSLALEWHQKALTIFEKVLGVEHPDTAISYYDIGVVYGDQGNYPQALDLFFKAFRICFNAYGVEHSDTIDALKDMLKAFIACGRRREDFEQWLKGRMGKNPNNKGA